MEGIEKARPKAYFGDLFEVASKARERSRVDRYETFGRIMRCIDGSGDYYILEWDDKKNHGRATDITANGNIIHEQIINRETYNWGTRLV